LSNAPRESDATGSDDASSAGGGAGSGSGSEGAQSGGAEFPHRRLLAPARDAARWDGFDVYAAGVDPLAFLLEDSLAHPFNRKRFSRARPPALSERLERQAVQLVALLQRDRSGDVARVLERLIFRISTDLTHLDGHVDAAMAERMLERAPPRMIAMAAALKSL